MSEELKPCPFPFCGGEAELFKGRSYCWIKCKICSVQTRCWNLKEEAELIAAWNHRPSAWIKIGPDSMPEKPKKGGTQVLVYDPKKKAAEVTMLFPSHNVAKHMEAYGFTLYQKIELP